jgi:hypothetical protein
MGINPAGTKGKLVMLKGGVFREHSQLKELVVEASRALACLDADRLEELALSCQALIRDLAAASHDTRAAFAAESKEAEGDMAVFARVLEATRANLHVMSRLRELREGRLEYGRSPAQPWQPSGSGHGND